MSKTIKNGDVMNQQQRWNMIENTFFYKQERVEELTNKTFTEKEWDFIKDELEEGIGTNLHEIIDELIQEWMDGIIEYGEQRKWNSDYIPVMDTEINNYHTKT
jgi:hypothetical protein|tara:strand:+ start:51 stop:359 length:309 start_codon:yes stop_codon:yes gene_type:complete